MTQNLDYLQDNQDINIKIRYGVITICTVILLLIISVYWPVVTYDFINYDDLVYVANNSYVNQGLTIRNIRWAFFSVYAANWHPVTWLSYMIDCHFFGISPLTHHAINLILHVFNSLLFFILLFNTTKSLWESGFIAAFFAIHPMHVESVAWIAERKDVLSTFFMLLTLILYVKYTKTLSIKTYLASVLFFILGLMSKSMIVTVPFIMVLLDYWPLRRRPVIIHNKILLDKKTIIDIFYDKIPFFVLSFMTGIITVFAQNKWGAINPEINTNLVMRINNSIVAYITYIKMLIWPNKLSIFYPYSKTIPLLNLSLSFLLLTIITIVSFIYAKKKPYIIVGWLWYLITLLPVIGLLQVGSQSHADRYTYVPYIGLFIIIVFGLRDYMDQRYNGKVLYVLLLPLVMFSFYSKYQVQIWENSVSVFQNAINNTENNYLAHNNLGLALYNNDKKNVGIALWHFNEAIRINPMYYISYNNIGAILNNHGKQEQSIQYYHKAININPCYSIANYGLGNVYFSMGNYREAEKYYLKSINCNYEYAPAYNALGMVYAKYGYLEKAQYYFNESIKINHDTESLPQNNKILK